MKWFNVDQHISVIADIADIFRFYRHTVDSISLSGHASVMGLPKGSIPMLNGDNWCNLIHEKRWNEFYDTYGETLKEYDGFIVTYPPIFALLYEKFDKPIIIDIPIRYECGVDSDADVWNYFNEFLRRGIDDKRITVIANSAYDKKYTEAFLEREVRYIPSLCEYTKASYDCKFNNFIYYHSAMIPAIEPIAKRKYDVLQFGHSWQHLYNFAGIVHIPYNISTMSIFEQYTASVPLFFPSENFLLELYQSGYDVLSQYSWNRLYKKQSSSLLPFIGEHDPNNYNNIYAVAHWMESADFYNATQFPCLQYFNSFAELKEMLSSCTVEYLDQISAAMRINNISRKKEIYAQWKEVLDAI